VNELCQQCLNFVTAYNQQLVELIRKNGKHKKALNKISRRV